MRTLLRFIFSLKFVALVSVLTVSVTVNAQGPSCASIFSDSYPITVDNKQFANYLLEQHYGTHRQAMFEKGPTVRIAESNAQFVILQKKEPQYSWYSDYSTLRSGLDIQGDPTSIFLALSPETAARFGFVIFDGQRMRLPRVDFLNTRLQQFYAENKNLKSPSVQFYTQDNMSPTEYLRRFALERLIPLADPSKGENHFVHDYAFHTTAVLLPLEYARLLQLKVAVNLAFLKFARQKLNISEKNENSEWYATLINRARDHAVGEVDRATANLSTYFWNQWSINRVNSERKQTTRESELTILKEQEGNFVAHLLSTAHGLIRDLTGVSNMASLENGEGAMTTLVESLPFILEAPWKEFSSTSPELAALKREYPEERIRSMLSIEYFERSVQERRQIFRGY